MTLAKFRHQYPQGSLVGELIEIDRGTYIVKASAQVDNIVLATALAGAATVEAAEDAAKERAIATLFLDERPNTTVQVTPPQTAQIPTPIQAPEAPPKNERQNVNFSEAEPQPQPQPVTSERPLTPVTVPLKPVAETTESKFEPEATSVNNSQPPVTNSLFGDTFTAETPIKSVVEDSTDPIAGNAISEEQEAMDFNEIKQKTDIEIKRLSWTKDQGKDFLMSRYGKRSRLHLTDEQLLEFLRYLETLPSPVK